MYGGLAPPTQWCAQEGEMRAKARGTREAPNQKLCQHPAAHRLMRTKRLYSQTKLVFRQLSNTVTSSPSGAETYHPQARSETYRDSRGHEGGALRGAFTICTATPQTLCISRGSNRCRVFFWTSQSVRGCFTFHSIFHCCLSPLNFRETKDATLKLGAGQVFRFRAR